MTTVVFSHGKESGPWGSKITTLSNVASDMGFGVESIDYQDLDCPEARLARLKEFIAEKCNDVVLVGSSKPNLSTRRFPYGSCTVFAKLRNSTVPLRRLREPSARLE